jgi:hypothetical protein
MSEPEKVVVDAQAVTEPPATCCECDEVIERCLRHEAIHLLKTRGKQWLMARAVEWMAEGETGAKASGKR